MSELYQSLSHSKWDCKYHVVFVSKLLVPVRNGANLPGMPEPVPPAPGRGKLYSSF